MEESWWKSLGNKALEEWKTLQSSKKRKLLDPMLIPTDSLQYELECMYALPHLSTQILTSARWDGGEQCRGIQKVGGL